MSFQTHPGPGSGPLAIASGAASPVSDLADHFAVDPSTGRNVMYVRVVQVGEGDARAAPPPSITLSAGGGPPVELALGNTAIPVQSGGATAAVARLSAEPDDVQLVELELLAPDALPLHLTLGNRDSTGRRYVWVTGSTDLEARQPWLDVVTGSVVFDTVTGVPAPAKDVALANYGSGPVTIADPDGSNLGSGFRLVSITPRSIAPNRRAVARIGYLPGGAPTTSTGVHDLGSDDPNAGETAGHSRRLVFSASVRIRPGVLEVVKGVGGGPFGLDRLVATVGRAGSCDIILDEPTVSPRHAEIRFDDDTFEIVDLDSANGTYVNKVEVNRAVLANEDLIQLGKCRLKFLR